MAVQDAALPDVQSHGRDVFFALGLIFILTVLFVPIPAMLIDFGLALSVSLSILILMVSLWIARPLDFSSFPTVLLIVTMLRLSLNIATTRAIPASTSAATSRCCQWRSTSGIGAASVTARRAPRGPPRGSSA